MDGVGRFDLNGSTEDETGDEARTRQRDSLFLAARLQLAGFPDVHEVRVRNLSAGGLMAELDRVVPVGTAVALEMRGLGDITGTVAWCTRGRLGIALDTPIDPRLARKPVGTGPGTPEYAKAAVEPRRPRR